MRKQRLIASIVILLATAVLAPPVGADTLMVDDPSGDVAKLDSGATVQEPRADITAVDVDNQARSLEIKVTVAQFIPLDDPAWNGQIVLTVGLNDHAGRGGVPEFFWSFLPDGGGGATGDLSSFSDSGFFDCTTDARADEAARQYILAAGPDCLTRVPRMLSAQATISFDPHPEEFDFSNVVVDAAPDDGFSDLVSTGATALVSRVAGNDRIETAIAISQRFDDGTASGAVLASSVSSPDAIAGGPLAVAHGGPLLLTGGDGLDPRVEAELARVLPAGSDVYLLGGTGVLDKQVFLDVSRAGFHPRRLAGSNRFETAVAVADSLPHNIVFIADGMGFREALIAAAAAASLGGVVVLTDGTMLPAATDDFLAHDPSRHLAIGRASIAAPGAERITAPSVAALAVKVIDRLLPDVHIVGIASEGTYADALAGVPQLAALGGGLLLTDPATLSGPIADELGQRSTDLREVLLYGGTGAISAAVEDQVTAALTSSS